MRWELLFADLEARLEAEEVAGRAAAVVDLTRAERATVRLADRLRARVADGAGAPVTVSVRGGEQVSGDLLDSGPDWLLLGDTRAGRRSLVPLSAVAAVAGLGLRADPPGLVERRLTLGHALRALARDRQVVRVRTTGAEVVGRIGAVGADHVDVQTQIGASRTWSVPTAALLVVTSG